MPDDRPDRLHGPDGPDGPDLHHDLPAALTLPVMPAGARWGLPPLSVLRTWSREELLSGLLQERREHAQDVVYLMRALHAPPPRPLKSFALGAAGATVGVIAAFLLGYLTGGHP